MTTKCAVDRPIQSIPRHATPQQLELLKKPPLSSFLPYAFKDTGFVVKSLDCRCSVCNEIIPNDEVRGHVSDLLPGVLDIDVMGKCGGCTVYTEYRIRVRSNRSYEWRDQDGIWHMYKIYESNMYSAISAMYKLFLVVLCLLHLREK